MVLLQEQTKPLHVRSVHSVNIDHGLCAPAWLEVTVLKEIKPMAFVLKHDVGNAAGQQLVAMLLQPLLPVQLLFFVASKRHATSSEPTPPSSQARTRLLTPQVARLRSLQ